MPPAARTAIVIMTTASDAFGFAVYLGKKTGEERLKHCDLSTIPKKSTQNQAPKERAKIEVMI